MVRPDELDAMITSGGSSSSSCRYSFCLKSIRSGPFSWTKSALERCRQIGREREMRLRCAGREAQSLERRPGRLHELPQRGLGIRRDIGRDDVQSLRQEQRRPARADDAGSDDGDCGE